MSEWISVKERLPDDGGKVLVYNYELAEYDSRDGIAKGGIRMGRKTYSGRLSPDSCMGFDDSTTHWMPLPEPPK